jgi:beta-glucuronidase
MMHKAPARLLFQACSFYCRVWVNGVEVGDHRAGGYVAFFLDVPMQDGSEEEGQRTRNMVAADKKKRNKKGKNELVVLVDNRFNSTRAPTHTPGDYWHYSGIMRSVELHAMPPPTAAGGVLWPWRLYVLPQSLPEVRLTLYLTNPHFSSLRQENVTGTLAFDGGDPVSFSGKAIDGIVDLGVFKVPNPRVWSIEDPQLHTVSVNQNGAIVIERFGLRMWGVDKKTSRLTVNGKVIKLVGWSHHMQWPETAASPTDKEMDDDIALLREAGTNYVRGAHYPQDPRWLDRLDEAGMVMWCETLGAGVSLHNAQDPFFMKYQTQQLNEMMDNAMNHASIMLWAFFNEGPSDHQEACVGYEACAQVIKKRDPTRLVTWASNKLQGDKCLHAADVISFNSYPAWYGMKDDPTEFWNHHANSIRNGVYPGSLGKPFVISETGAGGIFEWDHNKTASRWTVNYQNKVISEDVDVAIQNSNISGITLWHFMDFKTYDNTENNTHCDYVPDRYPPICAYINATVIRPGGLNHKGVVDFWRRKKPIYDIVASKYNATRKMEATVI